ncbi:AraC family transcriptional regulator [Sphaerimonospora thailandensis]|uniref:AraC family transcriptional regulator n=1 Tax=Sphaerimonospora thailandensis TaxID=795644 RepID=A0A8J3VZK4_9ACTN|nr:AraC family transcriptional regulator [Sphaerimonospora thailandensis]GIH71254.1 AraC family transcriptional regulator [Sphaerimonospora thailandensis]
MDVLADALSVAGVRGTVAVRIDGGDDWAVSWARNADAVLYAVTTGTAWLTPDTGQDDTPVELLPGDVILLPTGAAHSIASDAHRTPAPCDTALADHARRAGAPMRLGSGDTRTHLLGASYRHDRVVSLHVFDLLPPIVHIRAGRVNSALDDTVRLLTREICDPQIATTVVLDRLVDVILVQLLRRWLSTCPDLARGSWLGALADPLVTEAMVRMHQQPARPWTTETLARDLTVSRSTLTRRFQDVTGQSPGAYLTRWRMDLAARRLRDTDDSIETIARSVGYTSVYAFNRAFRRTRSQPPARFRLSTR